MCTGIAETCICWHGNIRQPMWVSCLGRAPHALKFNEMHLNTLVLVHVHD